MSSPVTLADAIRAAVQYNLNNVHTALPAQIIDYDFEKQKASVQPLLNKAWADGTETPMPVLNGVPIIFPRAGNASLTFPVVNGDTCLLLFSERSLDLWKTNGGQVTPDDNRKFSLPDAIGIMGLFPFSENSLADNNEDVLLVYNDSKFRIKANGDIVIQTNNKIAIGDTNTEILDIISKMLHILQTSVTTMITTPIQQVPIPPSTYSFSSLKTQIDTLKGTIP